MKKESYQAAYARGTSVANLNFKFHKANMEQLLE